MNRSLFRNMTNTAFHKSPSLFLCSLSNKLFIYNPVNKRRIGNVFSKIFLATLLRWEEVDVFDHQAFIEHFWSFSYDCHKLPKSG